MKNKPHYAAIIKEEVMEDERAIKKDLKLITEIYPSFKIFHKASKLGYLDASAEWMKSLNLRK